MGFCAVEIKYIPIRIDVRKNNFQKCLGKNLDVIQEYLWLKKSSLWGNEVDFEGIVKAFDYFSEDLGNVGVGRGVISYLYTSKQLKVTQN